LWFVGFGVGGGGGDFAFMYFVEFGDVFGVDFVFSAFVGEFYVGFGH